MSKIARIYQGANEIQKYYQGGVLQRLFFDWKHYIGEEINIEYAKECAGRNVVISGKTIQDSNDLSNIESIGEKEDNLVTIRNYNYKCETDNIVLPDGTKNSIETIDGKKVHIQRVWKSPQISIDVFQGNQNTPTSHEFTFDIKKPVVPDIKKVLYDKGFFYLNDNKKKRRIGFQFLNYTVRLWVRVTKEEFPTTQDVMYFFKNNPMYVYFELKEPIYTYLESGLYDDIVLPNNTKNEISYSNGKHIHTRKIGKYIISGGSNETISIRKDLADSEYITFNINIQNNMEKAFIYYENSKQKMICDKLEISLDEFFDSVTTITEEAICMRSSGLGFCISILRSKLETEDTDGFRTWLSNNPITVYYELYSFVDSDLYYNDINYKLDEPLRSLTDKIYDYIKEGKVVRKIGKYTFTNKSYFSTPFGHGNPNNGTRLFETKIIPSKTSKIICDKFNYVGWGDISNTSKIAMARFGDSGNLIFRHNSTSLQEFQNYLLENPVTVYYELATPIETEITPDMILINGEPITDTVNIELPNGVKDSIENGYYIKRIRKVIFDGSSDEMWKFSGANNRYEENHNGANLFEHVLLHTPYIASRKENNFLYESIDNTLSPYYGTGANYISLPENSFMCQGNYINFGCHFDTLAEFRTFLSENPYTFWYELATPVKIPLFSIKEGLTTLKSTNNITPQIELDCLVRDKFKNMCDNEWERGDIDLNTGLNSEYGTRIRLKKFIKVKSNTKYRMDVVNSVKTLNKGYIEARYYDNKKSYLDMGGSIGTISKSSIVFTTPEDCCYIRFIAETTDVNFKIYLKEVF